MSAGNPAPSRGGLPLWQPAATAPGGRQPMALLLVEDDAADARLVTEFLARSRFFAHDIARAPDQAAAVALAGDKRFDVIILD